MSAKEILKNHPKGKDFANLLKDKELYPVFIDSNKNILSMPPIINSEDAGKVNLETKEIFIECSGTNLAYCNMALNILLASISTFGGKIYSMKIKGLDVGNITTPNMNSRDLEFNIENIERTLGIDLTEKWVKEYLERMGINLKKLKDKLFAEIPCYRSDILHPIDLSEEVAIAYGYENFIPEIPEISTIGEVTSSTRTKKVIGEILSGLGLLETSGYHLVNKRNVKKMHYDFKDFIELESTKTDRDVLRMDILTNLLQNHSENSNSAYPQKIFEIGRVFKLDKEGTSETGVIEEEHLSISLIDENIKFTEIKQILDNLFKNLDIKYEIKNTENNNYIEGRAGVILVNNKQIGFIGEIAPRVLRNWKIKSPVVSLEIDLGFLF